MTSTCMDCHLLTRMVVKSVLYGHRSTLHRCHESTQLSCPLQARVHAPQPWPSSCIPAAPDQDLLGPGLRAIKVCEAHRKHVCMRHRASLLEVVLQGLPGGLLGQVVRKHALATAAAPQPPPPAPAPSGRPLFPVLPSAALRSKSSLSSLHAHKIRCLPDPPCSSPSGCCFQRPGFSLCKRQPIHLAAAPQGAASRGLGSPLQAPANLQT